MKPSPFIDTHVHLCDERFDADRAEVIARSAAAGVTRLVEIADGPEEWAQAAALAKSYPGAVLCALGLHPYHADRFGDGFLEKLKTAVAECGAVAIGEIGLDYAKSEVPRETQLTAFRALARAGRDWDIPLVVHCRDAYADLLPVLLELFPKPHASHRFWGVVHCFSGGPDEAEALKKIGFALGADGPVTYKKNDVLRDALRRAGPDCVVLETDCPYLPPQTIRGQRNEPVGVIEIAKKMSELWSISPDEVAQATSRNARDLYRQSAWREIPN